MSIISSLSSGRGFGKTGVVVPPVWATASGSLGTQFENTAFSSTVSASSPTGAVAYSIVSGSLPGGLSLNGSTGAITGTLALTATTTFNFTLGATVFGVQTTRAFSITVNTTSVSWNTASGNLVTQFEATSVSTNPTASVTTGSPTYSLVSGSLPGGLSLNTSSCAITGTLSNVASSGAVSFTLRATNAAGRTSDQPFSITVNQNNVSWNTGSGRIATWYTETGQSVGVSASVSSGSPSYSVVSGGVPSNTSLSGATISGTPNGVGDYSSSEPSFTIRATSPSGRTSDRGFSILVYSRYIGYQCSTANEGGTCADTAQGPYIFNRRDFSSYGTPNGGCGGFGYGGCNSGNSNSWNPTPTKSYAVGANNSNWGDPCGGVGKRMYVQMSYGPF